MTNVKNIDKIPSQIDMNKDSENLYDKKKLQEHFYLPNKQACLLIQIGKNIYALQLQYEKMNDFSCFLERVW